MKEEFPLLNSGHSRFSPSFPHAFVAAVAGISLFFNAGSANAQPVAFYTGPEITAEPKFKPLNFEPLQDTIPPLGVKLAAKVPALVLSALPADLVQSLQQEDTLAKGRLRMGLVRDLESPLSLSSGKPAAGGWSDMANATRVWARRIDAQGAAGIRAHLQSVTLPAGARLLVYDAVKVPDAVIPIYAENLASKTDVWLPTVFSESMIIECQVPAGIDAAEVSFTVNQVSHLYRSLAAAAAKLGTCHNDVTCYPTWAREAAGVALMQFQDGYDTFLCTGSLISDRDPNTYIDYFLTANHCVHSAASAASLECFWYYQTKTCGGIPPDITTVPRTYGADYLAGSSGPDCTLLRLRQRSPSGVTYLGWTTGSPSGTLTCIHHPGGSFKRISFGGLSASSSTRWTVQWSSGVTEEGSSGSPLMNSSHYIIGQLYGGPSSCDNPHGTDDYGRFNVSYAVLWPWLDNAPLANDSCSGAISLTDNVYYSESNSRAGNDSTPGLGTIPAGVWFKWTAPMDGLATVDTCGSDFDTVLEVMSGSCGALSSEGNNDDSSSCGVQAALNWPCAAGRTYLVCVGGFNGASGNLKVRVHAVVGTPARFLKAGTPVLNGATTDSITLQPGDSLSGAFSCWATNRQYSPGNYILVAGLVNSWGQWVGGTPQSIYSGSPAQSGELLTVAWSGLAVPNLGGTYKLRFAAFPSSDPNSCISQFASSPPVYDRTNSQGLIATVNVLPNQPWQLWWRNTSGVPAFWNMDGTNCCSYQQLRLNIAPVAPGWNPVGTADFSEDGSTDILWQNTNGWVAVWLLNGTNCWRQSRIGTVPAGAGWQAAATGDLDGDGHPDILFQHTSGLTAVWLMNGTNIVRQARLNAPLASAGWRLTAVADVNNDGWLDLLWQHSTGVTAVWFMNGLNCTSYTRLNAPLVDSSWQMVGTAHLFDNAHTELLWQHANGTLAFWYMDGINRLGGGALNPSRVDPSWRVIGPK